MTLRYLRLSKAELPAGADWLSPAETRVLESLRVPKRRQDWLLGRWTAKSALQRLWPEPPDALQAWEILAADDGAPEVRLHGRHIELTLSLSHSGPWALAALVAAGGLGCDMERIEARHPAFEETWFTAEEIATLNERGPELRPLLVTLVWSAKESVLKLLRTGLRADTRRIEVSAIDGTGKPDWSGFEACDRETGRRYAGWWRRSDGFVHTVAGGGARGQPPQSLT